MEPTNQKALYHKLMDSIDRVLSGELTPSQGKAVSELAARMNKAKDLEHDRARVCVELDNHARTGGKAILLREIEGKNFD
jgi:hypothetical protein